MNHSKEYRIGIFEDRISLYSYIDDKLIFYSNHTEAGKVTFVYDKAKEKIKLKEFLSANDYKINRELVYQHEVRLLNFKNGNKFHHLFIINTACHKDVISKTVDTIVGETDDFKKEVFIYLFNSDSNLDYYEQNKRDSKSIIVSSPSDPIKITNPFPKPF